MWGLRKRSEDRVERVEGDLKGEGKGEGGFVVGVLIFSFRSADRSSSFNQPTALVFKFS